MTWISFVIVAIVFYSPLLDLGASIVHAPSTDFVIRFVSLTLPITGYGRLFVFSLAAWIVLSAILIGIESLLVPYIITRLHLRNGLLFASRPDVSLVLAEILAWIILGYFVVKTLLTEVVARFIPAAADILPIKLDMILIVLSLLTLIAVFGFKLEQTIRYTADIRRNQLQRKKTQNVIITR